MPLALVSSTHSGHAGLNARGLLTFTSQSKAEHIHLRCASSRLQESRRPFPSLVLMRVRAPAGGAGLARAAARSIAAAPISGEPAHQRRQIHGVSARILAAGDDEPATAQPSPHVSLALPGVRIVELPPRSVSADVRLLRDDPRQQQRGAQPPAAEPRRFWVQHVRGIGRRRRGWRSRRVRGALRWRGGGRQRGRVLAREAVGGVYEMHLVCQDTGEQRVQHTDLLTRTVTPINPVQSLDDSSLTNRRRARWDAPNSNY